MSGMLVGIRARSSNHWRPPASRCALKSSGPRTGLPSAAAIIIGSMSPAGTRCAGRPGRIGAGTASNRHSGRLTRAMTMVMATQKPGEGMRRPIENNSSPGQAVYEPFSGSGTTIIAAEMTGRSCFAPEIDTAYVDVAILRWQAFTGEDARLDQHSRSFAEVG